MEGSGQMGSLLLCELRRAEEGMMMMMMMKRRREAPPTEGEREAGWGGGLYCD